MVKLRFQDVENAYSDLKKASNLQYDEAEDAIWKYSRGCDYLLFQRMLKRMPQKKINN